VPVRAALVRRSLLLAEEVHEDRWEKVVQGARVRTDRYGKGERWRARYFDPDGQERARTFDRKTDAEKFLAGVASDKFRACRAGSQAAARRPVR
jgi:hypothetical protein